MTQNFRFIMAMLLAVAMSGCSGESKPAGDPDVGKTFSETYKPADTTKTDVATSSGTAKVEIPPAALPVETTITIDVKESVGGAVSSVYDFGPDGTAFEKPVTISIKFDNSPPAGKKAVLGLKQGDTWTPVQGSALANGYVTGEVTHFSEYAVIFVDTGLNKSRYSSAVSAKSLAAGDETCPYGGIQVDSGIDEDGNGILDAGEVDKTQYVCNGAPGNDGVNGQDGQSGAQGASGQNALAAVSDEPQGTRCADGGKRLETGLDADGNGTLDTGEITGTSYICNGRHASAPLVKTTAIAADPQNAKCPAGGVKLDIGTDTNGSGTLDQVEISETQYICNGAQGADGQTGQIGHIGQTGSQGANGLNALVSINEEPAGGNCRFGGKRLETGADADADGSLDSGEITATSYICNALNMLDSSKPFDVSMAVETPYEWTYNQSVTLQLLARDNFYIIAYYVSENPEPPSGLFDGWEIAYSPVHVLQLWGYPLELSDGYGEKTIHAWVMDWYGNIEHATATVEYRAIAADVTAPTAAIGTDCQMYEGGGEGSWIGVRDGRTENRRICVAIDGQDDYAMSAYFLSENPATPAVDDPAWTGFAGGYTTLPYTVSEGYGIKHLYLWTKDHRGNMSAQAAVEVEYGDFTAPWGTISFYDPNTGSVSETYSPEVSVLIRGWDNVKVTAYLLSEDYAQPSAADPGWIDLSAPSASYQGSASWTLSDGFGRKTLYLFLKDSAGNVSSNASSHISASIDYLNPDIPVVKSFFDIDGGMCSPKRERKFITHVQARNTHVTHYFLAEDSTQPAIDDARWQGSQAEWMTPFYPYTLSEGYGNKTVYIWFKDDAGNVVGASATVCYGI